MFITGCPKCGTTECATRLIEYEKHPIVNQFLEGGYPCEFPLEKTDQLDDLKEQQWE